MAAARLAARPSLPSRGHRSVMTWPSDSPPRRTRTGVRLRPLCSLSTPTHGGQSHAGFGVDDRFGAQRSRSGDLREGQQDGQSGEKRGRGFELVSCPGFASDLGNQVGRRDVDEVARCERQEVADFDRPGQGLGEQRTREERPASSDQSAVVPLEMSRPPLDWISSRTTSGCPWLQTTTSTSPGSSAT